MKKIFISFLMATLPHLVLAQDCTSDEFVFDYYGKYQCKLGGTPAACAVVPKGVLAGLLGAAGYIGGKKLGDAVGTKLGQREARIRAGISDSVFNERLSSISLLHSEWSKAFRSAKTGQPFKEGAFWTLTNDTRWDFFGGHGDATQKEFDAEFLEKKGKLQLHMEGKKILSASELDKLQLEMNDLFERAKSHLFQKEINRKYRWMREGLKGSKLMGARVGKVGLTILGAGAIPGADLIQKEHLFSKCVSADGWFSRQGDNGELKSFIDISNDCSIEVKDSKLNQLIEMFPAQREEFFRKCPNCCNMLQKRNRELTEKIDRDSPTVVIDESNCGDNSMSAEVILNGNRYRHSYKKVGEKYEMITGLIPNNDDLHGNNKMKVVITKDGILTTPVLSNVNARAISSNFGIENMPVQIIKWHESLTEKTSPPASSEDLADIRKVQHSIAEQIKAVNLSFQSIKSFCENSQKKQTPQDASKSKGGVQ